MKTEYFTFTDEMIPAAGRLLAARHARNRQALPLLPARFEDPQSLLDAEFDALERMAGEFRGMGLIHLAEFIALRPKNGSPVLVIAARYFFRRQVEDNPKLFHGLAFAKLESLKEDQEEAFRGLTQLMTEQGQRIENLLGDVQATVMATHETVLDIKTEQQRQGEQAKELYGAVLDLQNRLDLAQRAKAAR